MGDKSLAKQMQERNNPKRPGVNVDRISSLMFVIGTAIAGVAGGLVGPIFSVYPHHGY